MAYGDGPVDKPLREAWHAYPMIHAFCAPVRKCRFHWRRNSIAMWDNRCTVHVASTDVTAFRHMEGATIKGERPF
jgi:taurine dioxygenase